LDLYFAQHLVESDEHVFVTCGSTIKLENLHFKAFLHSHAVTYGSGSGQQSVTGYTAGSADPNSFWVIRSQFGGSCEQGTILNSGDLIRLQHQSTKLFLHSHLHNSPLSSQQEVSCYGPSDTGDNWKVVTPEKSWQRGAKIYLQHVDTGKYLAVSDQKFGNPIPGQREIVANSIKNAKSEFVTSNGFYFPHKKQ